MADGYKGLGVATLALHEVASSFQAVENSMPLQQCAVPGAVIDFVIIPKIIGEADAMFDDTMSCQSGFSDNSMLEAADFEEFNKSKVRFRECLMGQYFRLHFFFLRRQSDVIHINTHATENWTVSEL